MINKTLVVPFENLNRSINLTVDTVYEGGSSGNISDDPVTLLLPVSNQGGVRITKKADNSERYALVALTTSGEDLNWPDNFDRASGVFTYFGDKRVPGDIHDTPRGGNKLLEYVFAKLDTIDGRKQIPPFFVFEKHPTARSNRSVRYLGLAVPGLNKQSIIQENLISVWRTNKDNLRFQNYQAFFTILNVNKIDSLWVDDLVKGTQNPGVAPIQWNKWIQHNVYEALVAPKVIKTRTKQQQIPSNQIEKEVLDAIHGYLDDTEFETFATHLFKSIHGEKVIIDEITRPVKDGGRDSIGRLQIGLSDNPVYITFSLEAKRYDYKSGGSVGVTEVSRLASRVKHREFGVVVTTGYFGKTAQEEVIENRDPIILICGKDIAQMLIKKNINTASRVKEYLNKLDY